MVKMVEVIVKDSNGKIVNRVAYNEELFNYVLKNSRDRGLDLTTLWFIRIMRGIFAPVSAGGSQGETYTDTGGTSRGFGVKIPLGSYRILFNTSSCNNRLWIGYGNSSTSPTRSDYKLGNKLNEGLAGISIDEDAGTLTISASFTMTTDTIIYEVGLEWETAVWGYDTVIVCGRILLDRTVFPNGIAVSANQTITIVYRFLFP